MKKIIMKQALKHKTGRELINMLKEDQAKLGHLMFQRVNNQLKRVDQLKKTKKSIARLLTKLSSESK